MEYFSQLQRYFYNFLYTVLTSLVVYLWGFLEFSFVWVLVGTVVTMMSDQRKERREGEEGGEGAAGGGGGGLPQVPGGAAQLGDFPPGGES